MRKIRPNQVLQLGDDFGKRYIDAIPHPRSGGMNAFERLVIIKLLHLVNPKRVFEFGTYFGETTRLVLDNLDFTAPSERKVFTLDLDELSGVHFESYDAELAASVMGKTRAYEGHEHEGSVVQIFTDSKKFSPSEDLKGSFEFVIVDGNHAIDYVRHDTEVAFEILDSSQPYAIIWDDYGVDEFPELTEYLDMKSKTLPNMFHIEDTNFAVLLSDNFSMPPALHGPVFDG